MIQTRPLQSTSDDLSFVELCGHLMLYTIKHIASFGQIAQWLERVHGKHKIVGSNPTRANFLYGIEKP